MKTLKQIFINVSPFLFILFLLFAIFALTSCELEEETFTGIEVDYPGDFFAFIYNTDTAGTCKLFVVEKESSHTWSREELVPIIGDLYKLDLRVHKTTGPAYQDQGDMYIRIYESGNIVHEEHLEQGITETKINYTFQNEN